MTIGTVQLMRRLGYPEPWLEDAAGYRADQAYIAFDPAWVEEFPDIPEQTVDTLIHRNAANRPDQAAIRYLGRTLTYRQFDELIGRATRVLREHGIGRGDVVAVMVPTSAMHWVVFFALARIGAVHCGVNVMYRGAELAYQLGDVGPAAIVCLDHFLPRLADLPAASRPAQVFSTSLRDLADPDFDPYPALLPWWQPTEQPFGGAIPLLDALADAEPIYQPTAVDVRRELGQVVYTSGTTGRPKGTMQTHYNITHNALTHTLTVPADCSPITYSPLPMFHTGGFFVFSLPVFALGGVVIPRPLFDPADALECLVAEGVNVLFGPPTLFAALLALGVGDHDLSGVKVCATGAAPIPDDLPARWETATGLTLRGGWGMTELNSLGTYTGLPGRTRRGTVGVPVAGEVRIVADDGAVASRGEVGEIEFRGMQVSRGYLGKPEDTAATFRPDGWVRTGDLGLITEDGFLDYVDRRKELIITSGYNVSPAEIETTILGFPGVTDVAVVGEPHGYKGEVPVAYVTGPVIADEVLEFCRARLSAIKVPARVELLAELPKNALGKTVKGQLGSRGSEVAR